MNCDFCYQPTKYYTTQQASVYCENHDCKKKALEVESKMLDEHDEIAERSAWTG